MALEPAIPARLTDEPEFADELDEAIVAGSEITETARTWQPTDLGQAEWAMRKLAALRARGGEIGRQAREWRGRIDAWEQEEMKRIAPGIAYFDGRLQLYALTQRASNPREARATLPSGYIATTVAKTPTIDVVDEDALIVWAADTLEADDYDAVVKTELSVLISELRKRVAAKPVERMVCANCGIAIVAVEPRDDDPDGVYEHDYSADAIDPDAACDAPTPTQTFAVVLTSTGEVVPGVRAYLKDATAKVTVLA